VELKDLEGMYAGETVWVLGSGATLNYLNPAFFNGKVVVSTNLSAIRFGVKRPDFVFSHYHGQAKEALDRGSVVVTLARDTLTYLPWDGNRPDNLVLIPQDTYVGPSDRWDPNDTHRPRPDSLVYGSSSIHGAMHLAAHIGASHIVMAGADCGRLDGTANLAGYLPLGDGVGGPEQDRILSLYERDHNRMKRFLLKTYRVEVYSLNPFVNLNLEGHRFVGPDGRY
jgi:hypothetical protein